MDETGAFRVVHADAPGVAHRQLAARMVVTTIESLTHRFIAREGGDLDVEVFVAEVVTLLSRYLRG